jgi:hypothetical protein
MDEPVWDATTFTKNRDRLLGGDIAHESPRTTKLYDRTTDQVDLDEIERILV